MKNYQISKMKLPWVSIISFTGFVIKTNCSDGHKTPKAINYYESSFCAIRINEMGKKQMNAKKSFGLKWRVQ